SAYALHKESPPAYRITTGASHSVPQPRTWGNYVAFTAAEDLAHTGNTSQQVFYFNLAYFDCFQGTTASTTPCPNPLVPFIKHLFTGEIQQITHGHDGDSVRPSLNDLGGILVFQSSAHLTFASTPAGVDQVYLYEVKNRLLYPLTAGAGPSTNAITNQDGS